MNVSDIDNVERTDEQWREILNDWSDDFLLTVYHDLSMSEPVQPGGMNVAHALWCMYGAILERMESAWTECPNHEGNFDCTSFCAICEGKQEYLTKGGK